jgi:hypothetical protein
MIPKQKPGWAVQHARAALNIGMKVPQVEQELVAIGRASIRASAGVAHVADAAFVQRAIQRERPGHG